MARVKLRCVMRCPGLKSSYQEKGTTTMKNSIQQCIFQGSFSSFGKNISFRAKLNIFNLVPGQSLTIVYTKYPKMKFIAGVISLRSFGQKCNFISGDRCYVSTTGK